MLIKTKVQVVLKTDFIAVHCWPGCDIGTVSFLKYPHRHNFYVVMKFPVTHNDRDIEFLSKKQEVDTFIKNRYSYTDLGPMSCEDIAEQLLDKFGASFVSVYEDNENGAEVTVCE
jgi:hypothetical protein